MYKVIKIGEKDVPMLSVASSDVYYNRLFRENPLSVMTDKKSDNGQKTKLAFGMGFIMAKFAETKDRKAMLQLSFDDYLDWLEQFSYGDYIEATPEILMLYYGQKAPTVTEKN